MRTLIVSDLHVGGNSGIDLLRRPRLRAALIERLAAADRLVLLGDVLELRHGPLREAMAAARPFFEDLGRALDGRELVIAAGNHDHALVEPWLEGRGGETQPSPLAPEQLFEPEDASPALSIRCPSVPQSRATSTSRFELDEFFDPITSSRSHFEAISRTAACRFVVA